MFIFFATKQQPQPMSRHARPLKHAIEAGNLQDCQQLVCQNKNAVLDAFRYACEFGQLDIAKWLFVRFKVSESIVRKSNALYWATSRGHLNVVEWLCDMFNLMSRENARQINLAFTKACMNGHLEAAIWLAEEHVETNDSSSSSPALFDELLGLSEFDLTDLDQIFGDTSRRRKPVSCQLLHRRTIVDAFLSACEMGRLHVTEWLVKRFNITAEDTKSRDNYAFRWACHGGHVHIASWLVEKFNVITSSDVEDEDWAFQWACSHSTDDNIVNWLQETYCIEIVD
jgi:hypothetical protein